MPLFGRHQEEPEPEPVVEEPPKRSSSIFHRNRPESISPSERSTSTVSSSPSQTSSTRHRGFLHKNQQAQDPVIAAAEQRIINAEQMEREADRALINAREAVREAREHMRQLKLEMEAQAKALKVRQGQANNIYKRAKPLGRHEIQGLR